MGDVHEFENHLPGEDHEALFQECPECGDYSSTRAGVEGCTSESCSRYMGDDKFDTYLDLAGYKKDPASDRGAQPSRKVGNIPGASGVVDYIRAALPGHGSHHEDGKPSYMDEDKSYMYEDSEPSYMDKVMSGEYDPDTIEDEGKSYDPVPEDFLPGDDYQPPF